ncbi:hypothetical protein CB1_000932068 [Camelus ferus]|nr:hypothetical protein CB1_000932068 [Camelus ferus]
MAAVVASPLYIKADKATYDLRPTSALATSHVTFLSLLCLFPAVFAPGLIVRKALSEEKRVSTKTSAADLVTETDQVVEDLILSELHQRFPSHRFIAEEAVAAGAECVLTASPTWIVDPIDGTCNFVHRFPTVAVSIGFAVDQELEFGVIHDCTEERLYTGRRGRGAFCNGQRLHVSTETGGPCAAHFALKGVNGKVTMPQGGGGTLLLRVRPRQGQRVPGVRGVGPVTGGDSLIRVLTGSSGSVHVALEIQPSRLAPGHRPERSAADRTLGDEPRPSVVVKEARGRL